MTNHDSKSSPATSQSLTNDERAFIENMRVASDDYSPFTKDEVDRLLAIIDRLTAPQPPAPDYRRARGVLATDEKLPEPPPFVNKPFQDDGKWYEVCCARCDSTNIADKDKEWDEDGFAHFVYYCQDCKRYSEVYARETDAPAEPPRNALPADARPKLTAAQRLPERQHDTLVYLKDGDRIYRNWGKLTGNWIIKGDWGTTTVSNATVSALKKKGLVTISEREGDLKYVRLTAAGRAALSEER